MKQINQTGLNAIEQFLKRRHKNGPDFEYSIECWVMEALQSGKVVVPGYASNDGQGHSLQMRPGYFDQTDSPA